MRRGAALMLALALSTAAPVTARAQDLERWLGDLASPKPTTYRIAAAYVAHAGTTGLDSLTAWLPAAGPVFRAHAKVAIAAALLTSIGPDDLARHPTLRALASDELAAADSHAAPLCASREYERDIGIPADSTMRHHAALVALGAWAVPAAVALTHCATPTGRVFGLHVLMEIRAGGQASSLTALAVDSSIVIASEDEDQARTTVAAIAGEFVQGYPFSNHVAGGAPPTGANQAEEMLNAVVHSEALDEPEWRIDNLLRSQAQTGTAHTWDEYWQRARPVLVTHWDPPPATGQ